MIAQKNTTHGPRRASPTPLIFTDGVPRLHADQHRRAACFHEPLADVVAGPERLMTFWAHGEKFPRANTALLAGARPELERRLPFAAWPREHRRDLDLDPAGLQELTEQPACVDG